LAFVLWANPSTHVIGSVIAGGPRVEPPAQVQFEHYGVIAFTATVPPAQTFEIWLRPGVYFVTVKGIPCGMNDPRAPVTIDGPRTELRILCNLAG
jgi:hypothetical protein